VDVGSRHSRYRVEPGIDFHTPLISSLPNNKQKMAFSRAPQWDNTIFQRVESLWEEWGEVVEPIGLTYYTMLDIGNILLFEPGNEVLRERLRIGAESLLKLQKADGSWGGGVRQAY
jgi:hypothetical protein